jgi:hypothetical protein
LFTDDDYHGRIGIPAMLWQLDNGDWLGVSQATVGYGGSGCESSRSALLRAGVDETIAGEIIRWRFCDAVDLNDPSSWDTRNVWPVHPRSGPTLVEDRIVINVMDDTFIGHDEYATARVGLDEHGQDSSGFYPSRSSCTPFQAWLDFLNEPADAKWAQGPRVARVFLDESTALAQGFAVLDTSNLARSTFVPTIVIEQGYVQIWWHSFGQRQQHAWLTQEAYEALGQAGVYPAELAERDAQNARPLRRFRNSLIRSAPTQPYIDVSATGTGHLAFTPRPDSSR